MTSSIFKFNALGGRSYPCSVTSEESVPSHLHFGTNSHNPSKAPRLHSPLALIIPHTHQQDPKRETKHAKIVV